MPASVVPSSVVTGMKVCPAIALRIVHGAIVRAITASRSAGADTARHESRGLPVHTTTAIATPTTSPLPRVSAARPARNPASAIHLRPRIAVRECRAQTVAPRTSGTNRLSDIRASPTKTRGRYTAAIANAIRAAVRPATLSAISPIRPTVIVATTACTSRGSVQTLCGMPTTRYTAARKKG